MGFYQQRILPLAIDCACSSSRVRFLRERLIPLAEGKVLEVGMGAGINLEFYNPATVACVWGVEPSEGMRQRAQQRISAAPVDVRWLGLSGESIPLDDASMDSAVLTFTLCTIPDWRRALAEIHRTLKPDGKLYFCEHGLAPEAGVQRWQQRLDGIWSTLGGGCHLNRPILSMLEDAGFAIDWQESRHVERIPRLVSWISMGVASRVDE